MTDDRDLTARARIRGVALRMLAERGTEGTSLRKVAEQAGVSTGLVQHHFGSRAGLIQACDEYAIGTLLDQAEQATEGALDQPGFLAELRSGDPLILRYLARALVDQSPTAGRLYDAGADLTEHWLSDRWPDRFPKDSERVRTAAAAMASMHLGTIALHAQMSRRLGVDVLDPAHSNLIGSGIADIYQAMTDFLASPEGSGLAATTADDTTATGAHDE